MKTLEYKIFENDHADVLFSTSTCALFLADPLSLSILDHISQSGTSDRKRLREALPSHYVESEIEDSLRELERAGFIRLAEEDEKGILFPHGSPPPLPGVAHLVMNVSHACNLKCGYCYASGGSYNGKVELMSTDMALSLTDFLLENSTDSEVMITFFGGEPLLNTSAIKAAVTRGRELAPRLGKRIGFAITTNGTVHDREFIAFAASHGVRFTLSMDGPRDTHDRHRTFADGRGSYDEILPRLHTLLERVKLPARATLTKDNSDVVGIMDHLMGLGFTEVGFAPVDATSGELALGENEMERVLEGFRTLAGRFLEMSAQSRLYGFSNMINLMKLLHEGETKPLPCGAGVKLMGASPDGELFLCHRFTGNSDFRIGSVREGFDDRRRRELLESALLKSKPVCSACWARHLCGGGCHYLSHLHHGNIRDPHSLTCTFLRRWYEIGVKVYSHIAQENPDFLEKCTGMRLTC